MLPALLSSWLQDFSGADSASKLGELMHGSLFPLLFVIPVAVAMWWLFERNGVTDGRVGLQPESGRDGTTPRAVVSNRPAGPAAPWAHPPASPESALVLVADDSAVVRARLSRVLEGAGFDVVAVGDGRQALEFMQGGRLPSVLITDLEMPSVDGFELIAAVHGAIETEHLPIIAITGHDDLQARIADLSGIYGIFRKPWNDRELIRRVHALAGLGSARQPVV